MEEPWIYEYAGSYQEGESPEVYRARLEAYGEMMEQERAARAELEEPVSEFEQQLSSEKQAARAKFEARLQREVSAATARAKREYAIRHRKQLPPRDVWTQAVSWRSQARAAYAEVESAWEAGQRQQFHEWQRAVVPEVEMQLREWRETGFSKIEQELERYQLPKDLKAQIGGVYLTQPVPPLSQVMLETGFPREISGLVAGFEVPIYTAARLLGLWTPELPPTLTGGLVSTAIGSIAKGELTASEELQQSLDLGTGYIMGSLAADWMQSVMIGKALSWAAQPVQAAWKGSRVEMALIKRSAWYAQRAARGIRPEIVFLPEGESVSAKLAEEFAWSQMADFQRGIKLGRTAVLSISQKADVVGRMPAAALLPSVFIRGGALKGAGYLLSSGREIPVQLPQPRVLPSLLTPVPVQEISRVLERGLKELPLLAPRVAPFREEILGAGLLLGVKALSLPRGRAALMPQAKVRAGQIPMLSPVLEPVLQVKQKAVPVLLSQADLQLLGGMGAYPLPLQTGQPRKRQPWQLKKKKRKKDWLKELGFKKQYLTYPVRTPKDTLKYILS
jgi:hypothetical protein